MDFGGQPNAPSVLVAVDGFCARKKAERMSVRKSGLNHLSQFGWHHGKFVIVPKSGIPLFGFYFETTTKRSYIL